MWEVIEGQDETVATLRRAAGNPSHAYLLVGSRAAGIEIAARCLAAEFICADPERGELLVLRGAHPDVVEFEPTTKTYTLANEVREPRSGETYRRDRTLPRIIPEIHKAPVEGNRKVVLLHAADRMDDVVADALLKSIEEPPPRTVIVLITDRPDSMLATIRSRCQQHDLGYKKGEPSAMSVATRAAFVDCALNVDGSGAKAAALAETMTAAIDAAAQTHEATAASELRELDEQMERSGYSKRDAQGIRRRVVERHGQEKRRARTEALADGLAGLEAAYLGSLTDAGDLRVDSQGAGRAIDACRAARVANEFNPNEALLLERLVLHLPVARIAPSR